MEATFFKRTPSGGGTKLLGGGGAKLLGTRRGTLVVAGGCALFAGALLLVFLQQYRDSVVATPAPVTVLVADQLIPKATPGDVVTEQRLFKLVDLPADRVKEGALTDAAALKGKVAVADVFPGEQLTTTAFARNIEPVRAKLSGDQRAFSVPVDGAHGILGHLRRGDRVDVFGGFVALTELGRGRPLLRTLMQDILVLDAPKEAVSTYAGSKRHNVALRVTDRQAAQLAFASENGKVWLAIRPPAGATSSRPSTIALEALLLDTKPILRARAGR